MRIAEATVSGCSTGRPSTIGAAPSAWKPYRAGRPCPYSTKPFHQAVTLPALPTGMASASGAAPSSSQTSKAAVFWPSMRYGLIELTSSIGWCSTTCFTSSRA